MARRLRGVSGSVRQLLGDAGTAIFGQGEKEWAHAVSGFAALPFTAASTSSLTLTRAPSACTASSALFQKPSGTC